MPEVHKDKHRLSKGSLGYKYYLYNGGESENYYRPAKRINRNQARIRNYYHLYGNLTDLEIRGIGRNMKKDLEKILEAERKVVK